MPTASDKKKLDRMAELEKLAKSRIEWPEVYEYLTDDEKEEYDKLANCE